MTPLSALIAHIVHVAVSGLRRMFLRIVLCKFIGNGYSFCIEVKKKKKKKSKAVGRLHIWPAVWSLFRSRLLTHQKFNFILLPHAWNNTCNSISNSLNHFLYSRNAQKKPKPPPSFFFFSSSFIYLFILKPRHK